MNRRQPLWQIIGRSAVAGLLIVSLLMGVHFLLLSADLADNSERRDLQNQLPRIGELVEIAWREDNYPLLVQMLDNAKASGVLVDAWLVDNSGHIVLATDEADVGKKFTWQQDLPLQHYDIAGAGALWASPEQVDRAVLARSMLERGAIFIISALLLLVAFVRWRFQPLASSLHDTAVAARAMAEGDFARRLPPQPCLEIDEVGRALNYAAERLQELTDDLNRQVRLTRQATEAKNLFLASMSHELRTPLNAVLGFGSLLGDTELSAEQRAYLEQMHNGGELLLGIISDLLDFSRIESGQLDLQPVTFAPQQLFNETAALLQERAISKHLDYRCEITADMPPALLADAGRLRQVLINLLGNAIKFTAQGEVVLRASWQPGGEQAGMLHFSVSDTGIGIAADMQPLLFRPFVQTHESIRERFGGTGLGLAICKQIIDAMGGEISLHSECDKGTTFFVAVPVRIAATEQLPPASAELHSAVVADCEVLVAEDNPVNRLMLVTMLNKFGCRVAEAENGAQACALAEQKAFDLVFMDCQMPVMDGLQAAQQIRQRGASKTSTIIALTANAFVEDEQRCLDAGMNGFVTKPITRERLLAVLRRYVAQ